MTWPLASGLLLALALGLGFAWYERSRPSAKVLALVATLAALAVVGRIAFAPLPNVKPTTDVVVVAGGVLGGAPGFAVGAVAALASNLVFGQGPWTPWQMAGWGLCGLLGAALLRGRAPGRWHIAAVCALAAFLYGAVVDLGTASLAGGHDLLERWALMFGGTSLAWNVAHAAGNVAFALLFGPALHGALRRFRARLEVTWRPVPAAPLVALALLLAAGALAGPAAAGAATTRDYLRAAQNPDGGWGARPRARSSPVLTGWAALGLAAHGVHPGDVRRPGGRSALDFLRARTGAVRTLGDVERTLLVLGAAGESGRSFGGRDLVAALGRFRRRDGSYAGYASHTSFGILALRAVGVPTGDRRVTAAAAWLARQQERDGGWGFFRRGTGADADSTGAALEALAAAGRGRAAARRRGVAYLARRQARDGGWGLTGAGTNAQSTAYAVQGLVAAGRDPGRFRRARGRSALAHLRALATPSGAVRYSRSSGQDPVWVTAQAALALRRAPFPLAPVPRAPRPEAPRPRSARARAPEPVSREAPAPAPGASRNPRAEAPAGPARRPRSRRSPPVRRGPTVAVLAVGAGAAAALVLAPLSP